MTLSSAQSSAFETAGGFTASDSNIFWLGLTVGLAMFWGIWVFQSIYRGWATRNLDRTIAASGVVRWTVLFMIMTFMLLH